MDLRFCGGVPDEHCPRFGTGGEAVCLGIGWRGWLGFRCPGCCGCSRGLDVGLGALFGFRRGNLVVWYKILEHLWEEEEDVVRDCVPDVHSDRAFHGGGRSPSLGGLGLMKEGSLKMAHFRG